ncbi:hypothetical protein ACLIBG_02815 [Virgibacillus sp. W0181]|uniref:hypothetical protein n=1 Tax=Virgibacillus sp. W0181 TaxID=3391581 RepID=UPI003F459857
MKKNNDHHHHHMYEMCKNHMHAYVLAQTADGSNVDGIITGLDDEYVYMAVPLSGYEQEPDEHSPQSHERQFGYSGYGYPGYGYPSYGYPGYGGGYGSPGYGYRPRRRFRRLILPLAALTALSVLPWY